MAVATTRVTRNFQITLPKEIREREGLGIGDEVLFTVGSDSRVRLQKNDRDEIFRQAAGIWKDTKESGAEYVRKLRAEWKKREERINARH
jgi:AbrB family looped-hinge helix DNA binding protein